MLGLCGVVFIFIGGFALLGSGTLLGQIGGLVLWVIAALFIVGQAVVSTIEREARRIAAAPAPKASKTGASAERPSPATVGPSGELLDPEAGKQSLWQRFKNN